MTPEEQVARNIELAGRFLRDILADPEQLDTIPEGTEIVLIPTDDPPLAETNIELARQLLTDPEPRADDRKPSGISLKPVPA